MNKRILIVGAGLAGTTTAYWLSEQGNTVTLVERAEGPRPGGNGVDVRGHAIEVIERMGILEQVRALAADAPWLRFVDSAGRVRARIGIGEPGSVEIMRGDLVRLLHDRTVAEYRYGNTVRALRQDAAGVRVGFEHGPDERFDLVIGADGAHSGVRRLAFGPESRFAHYKQHCFAVAQADAALGADRTVTFYNSPGRAVGLYRSGNHAQATANFIFRSAPPGHDYRDGERWRRLLKEAFGAEKGWCVPQLLESALTDPDIYFDSLTQIRMDSWATGRIALVGDAAWCASPAAGAGAELALAGAYLLAGELAAAGGDHEIAWPRYQARHRDLVRKRQRIGPNLWLMAPKTRGGINMRNTLARLPILGPLGALERASQARTGTRLSRADSSPRGPGTAGPIGPVS